VSQKNLYDVCLYVECRYAECRGANYSKCKYEYSTATVGVAGGFCNELCQCKWLHLGQAEIRSKLPGFEEKKKKVLLVKSYQFTAIFTKV
jgi:hypothetical protein